MSARTKKEFRSAETWVPNDESEMKNLKGNLQEADPEEQRVDPVLSWMNFAEDNRRPVEASRNSSNSPVA